MAEPSRRRVTYGQLEQLWEFLIARKDLAMGYNKTAQAREFSCRMWNEIASSLNSHGDGAEKDWKGWWKYWNDYKCKLKKMAAAANANKRTTGGGPSTVKEMTEIELKFLQILGHDFGTGLPGIRVEPFIEFIETEQNTPGDISGGSNSEQTPGSASILTGMDLGSMPVIYDMCEPGPSSRVTHAQPAQMTPRRSPRRHNNQRSTPVHPPSPIVTSQTTPSRSSRRRLNLIPSSQFQPTPLQPQQTPLQSQTRPVQPQAMLLQSQPFPPQHHPTPPAPSPTHAEPQPVHTTTRRRRFSLEPPLTMQDARRTLVAESQKLTQIEIEKLAVMKELLKEFKEFKELYQQRSRNFADGE